MNTSCDARSRPKKDVPGTHAAVKAATAVPHAKHVRRSAPERPRFDASLPPWARWAGWQLDGLTHVAKRVRSLLWASTGALVALGLLTGAVRFW